MSPLKFTPVTQDDYADKGRVILVYGDPGVGKTSLCAELHNSEYGKLLYLDTEGGGAPMVGVVNDNGEPVLSVPVPNGIREIESFTAELSKRLRTDEALQGINTLVFDTVSTWKDDILSEASLSTKSGMPELRDYGKVTMMLSFLTREFYSAGKNVVFIGHQKVDPTTNKVRLDANESLRKMLFSRASVVFHMEVRNDLHLVTTLPTSSADAKTRGDAGTVQRLIEASLNQELPVSYSNNRDAFRGRFIFRLGEGLMPRLLNLINGKE